MNRAIRARDLDAIFVTGPGHGGPALVANTWLEGTYSEIYPEVDARRGGHARAVPAVLVPRRDPEPRRARDARARSTRAASSATRSPTPTARRSTTPTCSCAAWSATARPRPGPLAASWHCEQVPRPRARRRGAPDPAPQRLQDRQPDGARADPARRAGGAAGGLRAPADLRRGRRARARCTSAWRRRSTRRSTRSPRSSAGARGRRSERPRWPMIVLRTPKGWTGPEGGRRAAGRGHVARAPGAARRACARTRSTWRSSRRGCARTGPRSCSTSDGAPRARRRSRWRRRASAGWAPTRTPTAALLLQDLGCRTSATTRSTCPSPRRDVERGDPGARRVPARRGAAQPATTFRHLRARRDRVEPPQRRVRGDRPRVGRRARSPADDHLAPDGRVMEVLSEHLCQGWLEGYLLTGRHGLFNCYEAFIHIVDSMFNQHAKWLKVTRGDPVAAADRVAQLPAHARTSGARTTTASRTRTRASSTTSSTRRPRSCASTCRPTPTACCRWPTTACAAATTST